LIPVNAAFAAGRRLAFLEIPMENLRIHNGDWVVVCDGAKALILENAGDAAALNLKTKEVYAQPDPKTHEEGTDEPGRAFNSVDSRRSAVEQTDWHERDEERFLTDLSKRLNAAVMAGEAKSLVLVAPPRALGVIRQAATPNLRKALRAEIEKDFVRMPVHEIERHLAA
jgi:protein required for attachment to host cells